MANEILLNLYAKLLNGSLADEFKPGQIQITQTTQGRGGKAQTFTTAEEVIDFGDVATPGYCCMRNLDATYTFEYGPETASGTAGDLVVCGELGPGEPAVFRIGSATVLRGRVAGGTTEATIKVDIRIWED